MWKRFAAFLFILILAGQVWAGICGCLDGAGKKRGGCCKKKKAVATAPMKTMSAKKCCSMSCGAPVRDHSPRSQTETNLKIPAPVLAAVEKLVISLNWRIKAAPPVFLPKRAGDAPLLLFHPPELYLQNHAFLI